MTATRNFVGLILLIFALLSFASGCGAFSIQTPPKFLELPKESEDYDYRAATADGVVLAVTQHKVDAERGSTVQFWAEAIEARLRNTGGYALLEKKEARAQSGDTGMQLRFGHDQAQKPYLYWVTVFVRGDSVYVIEAGGAQEPFTKRAAEIERSIASFKP